MIQIRFNSTNKKRLAIANRSRVSIRGWSRKNFPHI